MAKTNAERQNLFRKKVAKRLHAANKVLDAQAKLSQAYEELALERLRILSSPTCASLWYGYTHRPREAFLDTHVPDFGIQMSSRCQVALAPTTTSNRWIWFVNVSFATHPLRIVQEY